MDTEILNLIKSWPSEIQALFSSFCVACVVFLCYTIIRLPLKLFPKKESPKEVQECNNEDNLKGSCLRAGGCNTQDECNYMVNELTYRNRN